MMNMLFGIWIMLVMILIAIISSEPTGAEGIILLPLTCVSTLFIVAGMLRSGE